MYSYRCALSQAGPHPSMQRTKSADSDSERPSSSGQRETVRNSSESEAQSGRVAALHRSAGNQAVQNLWDEGFQQPKLEVSQPGDPGEREAEAVARDVMRKPEPSSEDTQPTAESRSTVAHSGVLPSGGRPLSAASRAFFEPRFGRDFGGVRIHAGPEAVATAAQFGARAVTVGSHIVFGKGQYRPSRPAGRRLLAHELAHVTQDRQAVQRNPLTVEEIDELLAENERQTRRQNLSPEALDSLMETRARLLQLRSQLTGGESEVDYSLASSSPSRQVSGGPAEHSPEVRTDFYMRADAFSTGLDRLGATIDRVRAEVEREQNEWYVFSDRTFTRPVVDKILNEVSPFAEHASAFVAENGEVDPARADRLRNDIRSFRSKLETLRANRPEPIGGLEATGRRFVGGTKGAGGAFLGFLRLGLVDSWGQFVFDGSQERVTEAQAGLAKLMRTIEQKGFGSTVSEGVEAGVERLEAAERMGQHTAAAQQFGTAAFDLYFAGRGLVSLGKGGVQMSKMASALRKAGNPTPWRSALKMAGREAITFRGVGVHGGSGFWGSRYGISGPSGGPRGAMEGGENRSTSSGGRGSPPERSSGSGDGGGSEASQRVLVVGAETPEEFAYARSVAGRGHDVSVVNPKVTSEARAHMARGGRFRAERVEKLPREPSFDLIREDFPFPQGRALGPTESFAAERIARLAPGGRWVLLTESGEFAHTLRAAASRLNVRVNVRQYSRFPEFHEATPASSWPRDPTRFLVVFEKPPAPGP